MIWKILHNALTGQYYVYMDDYTIMTVSHRTPEMNKFICDAVHEEKGIFIEWTQK